MFAKMHSLTAYLFITNLIWYTYLIDSYTFLEKYQLIFHNMKCQNDNNIQHGLAIHVYTVWIYGTKSTVYRLFIKFLPR